MTVTETFNDFGYTWYSTVLNRPSNRTRLPLIKVAKAAELLQIHTRTLYRWEREGRIALSRSETGRVYVSEHELAKVAPPGLLTPTTSSNKRCAIYARVSSGGIRKSELASQKDRCVVYATSKGYQVVSVDTEIASGLNDQRPKLDKLLKDQNFDVLVVEHKDRLTRFGFEYINTMLVATNKEIDVINIAETQDRDLMDDFVSVITPFCARIYGQRRSTRKKQQLVEILILNSFLKFIQKYRLQLKFHIKIPDLNNFIQ